MPTVLIIDDDPIVQKTIRLVMEAEGYTAVCAPDGEEGLRLFLECRPDLTITDLIMPIKDGIQTIQDIRKHDVGTKIMAISGGARVSDRNDLAMAKRVGADVVFDKPFDPEDLVGAVRTLLAA